MRLKTSTAIIAAVTIAYTVFIACEFTGAIGHRPGELPAGMVAMLILLVALLAGDIVRDRRRKVDR